MMKLLPLFLWITLCLLQTFNNSVEGRRGKSLIEDEDLDLELERQLKIINKPTNITIQTNTGDVYACVPIQQQPALDHPKLKNHKVQLRPTSLPREFMDESPSTNIFRKATLQRIDCPEGTVPIKRVGKEELRASKRFFESISSRSNEVSPQASKYPGVYQAVAKLNGGYKGIRSRISTQKLENVAANHWSTAQVWVSDDPDGGYINSLWAGWIVAPTMFQDKGETRLFAHWGTDINKQCFNTYCGGFVATSKKRALGGIINPVSVYDGDQYLVDTYIFQDKGTGNWWLQVEEENVGYWPKGLIPALDDGASTVMWGGLTFGPANENTSPMGNGAYPIGADYDETCYSAFMKTVDLGYNLVDAPKNQDFNVDCKENYRMIAYRGSDDLGTAVMYGGPGGPVEICS